MARRGFFAELERQSRLAAQQRQRAHRAAVQQHNAAVRAAEQARRADERARAQLAKASDAERKRFEKEAAEAHVAAMEADVAEKNATLAEIYDDIDSLLSATLDVDDYVDLETLRTPAEHPPFDRSELEVPLPPPAPMPDPIEPPYIAPPTPGALAGLFGKKKHEEAVAAAQAAHREAVVRWRSEVAAAEARRQEAATAYAAAEADRLDKLERERARYASECAAREAETVKRHQDLDELIAGLGYGTVDAVQEYVAIVLSHSVYPEHFPVTHQFSFDPSTAELQLRVWIPGPDLIPGVKAYKYTKSSDSITHTDLSKREAKERYAGALSSVAVRSIHEVFEADRRGLIQTVQLEVSTKTKDPATGRETDVPLASVGAERASFMEFDLSAVVPSATLAHLGAAVSKDPYSLVPAAVGGVRRV